MARAARAAGPYRGRRHGLERIDIAPSPARLQPGTQKQFTALGVFPGGETRDLTPGRRVISSGSRGGDHLQRAGSKGLATVLQDAAVEITARIAGIEGELVFEKSCAYPQFPGGFVLGQVAPPSAEAAWFGDGNSVTQKAFSFEDLFCGAEYDHVRTVVIVFLGAGWCGACSAFAQRLDADRESLARLGAMPLFVEFETENYEPATTDWAQGHLTRLIGNGPGVRASATPTRSPPASSSRGLRHHPRRHPRRGQSAHQRHEGHLRLQRRRGPSPADGRARRSREGLDRRRSRGLPLNCLPGGEEASEPNNTVAQAAPLPPAPSAAASA
ncbi:MAG: hypothetical protein R3F43_32730 [bacterium]